MSKSWNDPKIFCILSLLTSVQEYWSAAACGGATGTVCSLPIDRTVAFLPLH